MVLFMFSKPRWGQFPVDPNMLEPMERYNYVNIECFNSSLYSVEKHIKLFWLWIWIL